MSRHGFQLPDGFTREDLAANGVTGQDADEILAFQKFLEVSGTADLNEDGAKVVGPVWFAYARGEITGSEALARIESAV